MAFFAIELTQGGNLRFPNLHVTQSIKRPITTCDNYAITELSRDN